MPLLIVSTWISTIAIITLTNLIAMAWDAKDEITKPYSKTKQLVLNISVLKLNQKSLDSEFLEPHIY